MNRDKLMDKLEEIQDKNHRTYMGTNESELATREDIATLFKQQMSPLISEINKLKVENERLVAKSDNKNYLTEARRICISGIEYHKTFPKYMKPEVIGIINNTFQTLGNTIGTIELTHLRLTQEK